MPLEISLPINCYTIKQFQLITPEKEEDRIINIDDIEYLFEIITQKGNNSYILGLTNLSDESTSDISLVMKICKFPYSLKNKEQRIKRFENEIKALKKCEKQPNIVDIINCGYVNIKFMKCGSPQKHLFYTMEYAEQDLSELIEIERLELIDKIELCREIALAFIQLHKMGYYHRDIKHDNILFFNGALKIGDLGLAVNQNDDKSIDIKNEKIGPYGWLSPEVMNKVLTEEKDNLEYDFDCVIDSKSDIFQLGKLFWYIFQSNVPIGNLKYDEDFKIKDIDIFKLIRNMLQYSKARRPNLEDIRQKLDDIHDRYSNKV